jgi:hypothetical protein
MVRRPQLQICDTRRGDDPASIAADATARLANVAEPVVIVDGLSFEWARHVSMFDEILGSERAQPFVICDAWWPGNRQTEAAVTAAFPGAAVVGPAFLAAPPPGRFVADVLEVRERRGGWASGTWIIGTCITLDALSADLRVYRNAMPPVFFAALDVFSSITGALCIDEPGAGSTLIVRVSPDNEAAVNALLKELNS